jgi:hypothetical protein
MVDHVDVAGYILGTLTPQETSEFEAHLETCARCRAELDELGTLPSLLAGAEAAPPEQLRRRTFDAVAAERAEGGGRHRVRESGIPWRGDVGPAQPPAAGPATAAPTGDGVVVPFRSRRAARWIGAAAAALLLVVAVGIGAAVLLGRDAGTSTIALVAGDVGSGRGEAVVRNVEEGREIKLAVSGLPANPPGTYYECWFVGPGDTEQQPNRVSAGTFKVGTDGAATVVMVSAADPARFPKMGVTLEPDDGNPARTGPKYLVSS